MVGTVQDIENLFGIHKGKACVIAGHGPSLNPYKDEIEELQKKNKILRFSANNWFNYFDSAPDYWVLASTEVTIQSQEHLINKCKIPVIFADSVDLTDYEFINDKINVDIFSYDQRHFKNKKCIEIFNDFRQHVEKNNNFNFKGYGENDYMWQPPRLTGGFSGILNYGIGRNGNCCKRIVEGRDTIQEILQKATSADTHYSTGDTVALHMIALAIIMGCNPIYIAGVDLDYAKGYAKGKSKDTVQALGHELKKQRGNLLNDLYILNESSLNIETKIINLNVDSWYDAFEKGALPR
jgi:hypothetical protein